MLRNRTVSKCRNPDMTEGFAHESSRPLAQTSEHRQLIHVQGEGWCNLICSYKVQRFGVTWSTNLIHWAFATVMLVNSPTVKMHKLRGFVGFLQAAHEDGSANQEQCLAHLWKEISLSVHNVQVHTGQSSYSAYWPTSPPSGPFEEVTQSHRRRSLVSWLFALVWIGDETVSNTRSPLILFSFTQEQNSSEPKCVNRNHVTTFCLLIGQKRVEEGATKSKQEGV